MSDAKFIYSKDLLQYKFSDEHPFNHVRVQLTYDLLKKANLLHEEDILSPRMATEDEIALVHDPEFIQAVKASRTGLYSSERLEGFGLGTEDTPIFPNMHEATALIVGATLTACDVVMGNTVSHAANLAGGLHHGLRGKASGFCIYNDCSIAIEYMKRKYGARVLYIDTDAHHGDGIQWSFYDDPDVCTLSIHETGRYLFPGTGHVNERGHGNGYGFNFNIPLDAFTEDESWQDIYIAAMEQVFNYFKPDVVITQNGADSHFYDPLTHLSLTMDSYRLIPKVAHELVHHYCDGRWIALGGGGYDIWRTVPRAWAMVWAEMSGASSDACTGLLPHEWVTEWVIKANVELPTTWEDITPLYAPIPRKEEITEKNRMTMEKSLQIIELIKKSKRA